MAVKVKQQVYESHGREFETKAEADKYDALYNAREEYSDAQRKFQRLLAETQRTADGQVFEFGLLRDYYVVREFGGFPRLETVSFYGWNWTVDEDRDGVRIRVTDERTGRGTDYAISKLYMDQRNAEKALAAAQAHEIESLVRESNELRKRVAMPLLTKPVEQE